MQGEHVGEGFLALSEDPHEVLVFLALLWCQWLLAFREETWLDRAPGREGPECHGRWAKDFLHFLKTSGGRGLATQY